MKIAVTSRGTALDAEVDSRFGRCPYFVIVETDDMSFTAIANSNVSAGGGAGVQSAQLIADRGSKVVLTGHCGPNAFAALEAAGIEVVTGASGTVREAIKQYSDGLLSATRGPNVASHTGKLL
jgi:predicted Fe-Mo cluster-binding NifX family protein